MFARFFQLFRRFYHQMIGSISFVPVILVLFFLLVAILMTYFEKSPAGTWVLEQLPFLKLYDPGTARSILSTIVGGIISLTVFSFSLVMIMLNQAASNLTNRVLEGLVREKFHQTIMGTYIGTIVFTLVLLFKVRDPGNNVVQIPSISIAIAIFVSILDLFLFIYFLHYVTQSVKFSNIIQKIYNQTLRQLNKEQHNWISSQVLHEQQQATIEGNWQIYSALQSGYLQDAQKKSLMAIAKELDVVIRLEHHLGVFVIEGTPLYAVKEAKKLDKEVQQRINYSMDFYWSKNIDENTLYGYRQLSEIAVKALSPGINDPGTAILSMNALSDLLAKKIHHSAAFAFKDEEEKVRLLLKPHTFEALFAITFDPILNYGKADEQILCTFLNIIDQLTLLDKEEQLHRAFFKDYVSFTQEITQQYIINPMSQKALLEKAEQIKAILS